jgi:hypothetical protein
VFDLPGELNIVFWNRTKQVQAGHAIQRRGLLRRASSESCTSDALSNFPMLVERMRFQSRWNLRLIWTLVHTELRPYACISFPSLSICMSKFPQLVKAESRIRNISMVWWSNFFIIFRFLTCFLDDSSGGYIWWGPWCGFYSSFLSPGIIAQIKPC